MAASFIYRLASVCGRYAKIGKSDGPFARAASIGSHQFKLVESAVYSVNDEANPRAIEAIFHAALSSWRISKAEALANGLPVDGATEWFLLDSASIHTFDRLVEALGLRKVHGYFATNQHHAKPSAVVSELLGGNCRAHLLQVLFTDPTRDYGITEIASLVGQNTGNVSRWLNRWASLGLLEKKCTGRNVRYSPRPGLLTESLVLLIGAVQVTG